MKKVWIKGLIAVLTVALMLGTMVGCSGKTSTEGNKNPTIKIGSKTFTEQLLLGQMLYDYLQSKGYPVENKTGLGELAVIRPALVAGEIGVYWEYTNTGITDLMKHEPVFDAVESYRLIKEFDEKNGLIWLDYAPLDDTYAIVVRPDVAEKYNLKTTSDYMNQIKNGVSLRFVSFTEYNEREDGLKHFETVYGQQIPRSDIVEVAMGLNYDALKNNKGDLALAFTTEPRIITDKLVVLEDDKKAFAVYNPSPVFRKEILDAYPKLAEEVKALSSILDTETITELNKQVDVDKKSVEQVSKEFLKSKGLIN